MKKVPGRIVIYTRDVANITGRKNRTACIMLQKIRAYYNKRSRDFVTVMEFCEFFKLDVELVRPFLD